MIHGSGQTDLVDDLVVHPRLGLGGPRGTRGRRADPVRRPDGRDGHHRRPAAGRQRGALLPHRPAVPELARAWSTTRTAAAVSLWEPHLEGAVVAIGNAPTALFHLLEMLIAGAPRPAAIVGCPVGFIGAAGVEGRARRTRRRARDRRPLRHRPRPPRRLGDGVVGGQRPGPGGRVTVHVARPLLRRRASVPVIPS